MEKRLTLDDFKINQPNDLNELEKMMGIESVASTCHVTTSTAWMPDEWPDVDFYDYP